MYKFTGLASSFICMFCVRYASRHSIPVRSLRVVTFASINVNYLCRGEFFILYIIHSFAEFC